MSDHPTPLVNAAAEFRVRRRISLLALAILGAEWVVGTYVFADLHTSLEGVTAWAFLVALLSVGLALVGVFLVAWRCPACHHWLGFGGRIWWQQAACTRCGAIFEDAPPGTGDHARDQEAQVEAAVRKDAKYYRGRWEVDLLLSISGAVGGIAFGLVGIFLSDAEPERVAFVAIGALVFVVSIVLIRYDIRRLTLGARERERQMRRFLKEHGKG